MMIYRKILWADKYQFISCFAGIIEPYEEILWFSVKCWGNPIQVNLTGGHMMTIGIFMPWKIELCFVIS